LEIDGKFWTSWKSCYNFLIPWMFLWITWIFINLVNIFCTMSNFKNTTTVFTKRQAWIKGALHAQKEIKMIQTLVVDTIWSKTMIGHPSTTRTRYCCIYNLQGPSSCSLPVDAPRVALPMVYLAYADNEWLEGWSSNNLIRHHRYQWRSLLGKRMKCQDAN
jgi:hypothetical protein